MKSLGTLLLTTILMLSFATAAEARTHSKGHRKASQYLHSNSKHSRSKKHREVASVKKKKKKHSKKRRRH